VNVSNDTITVTHTTENFVGSVVGTPLYYNVTTSTGYFATNPRGVVFLKELVSSNTSTSTFKVSATPDGTVIDLEASMSGTFQLANSARTFAGNNVNPTTESSITVVRDEAKVFDGANDGSSGGSTGRVATQSSYSGTSISAVADDGTLDWYVGAMVRYTTTGSAASGLTADATYFVDTVFQSGTTTTYVFTLRALPETTSPVITVSGGSGTQKFTKIGVSIDRDIFHVRNHGLLEKDMVLYAHP
jgi:hypothetical protein